MVSAAFILFSSSGVNLPMSVKRFQDGFAAFIQIAQLLYTVADGGYLHLIQAAGKLFTVTGNKGHGSAFVKQGNGGVNLLSRL
jgi:hypothetical protein